MVEAATIGKTKHPTATPTARDALPAVVVAGPTASGKSGLALELAREFDGIVINADSMQVYRDLPILTAQPDRQSRTAVPHRLYGFLALDDACTAARWAALAFAEIKAARAGGKLPVLVGGTGLYLRALLEGFAPIPEIAPEYRDAARALLAEIGPAALHERLAERDPETTARLRPSDGQRIARAWEVLEATGKPLNWWQAQPTAPPGPVAALCFVTDPARETLYAACDGRFTAMIAQGAVNEVMEARRRYPTADPNLAGFRALGFRELSAHCDGKLDLTQAVAAARQATRHYAKRQRTWFRHQLDGAILLSNYPGGMNFSQSYPALIRYKIRDFLLTHSD